MDGVKGRGEMQESRQASRSVFFFFFSFLFINRAKF